jgi:hypothetical protein
MEDGEHRLPEVNANRKQGERASILRSLICALVCPGYYVPLQDLYIHPIA